MSRLVMTGLLSAAGYGACRIAVAKDHNMFGILFLWATTKGPCLAQHAILARLIGLSLPGSRPTRKAAEIIYYV